MDLANVCMYAATEAAEKNLLQIQGIDEEEVQKVGLLPSLAGIWKLFTFGGRRRGARDRGLAGHGIGLKECGGVR